jgi:hypothetical protein
VHSPAWERSAELRQLLNEWDFIGVYDPDTNVDEYDCMIGPLLDTLAGGADATDISELLRREIEGHFGMATAGIDIPAFAARVAMWWRVATDPA